MISMPVVSIQRISPLLAALLVAACAAPPYKSASQQPSSPATSAVPQVPVPAAATEPPSVPAGPVLDSPQAIQRTLSSAVENLEFGREEAAVEELQRVLQADPGQRLALSLMRQIKDDPQALLGRESFSYQVKPGESLSAIAGRFLRDVYMFYGLARYNDIKVPRQLAGGQTIRVPGKAPPPGGAVTVPAPNPAPSPAAAPAAAPAPTAPASAAAPVAAPAGESKSAQIARLQREARTAFAGQDLVGSIAAWDKVLAIDPDNRNAQLERQRAADLCRRLNDLTKGPKKAC
jgi:LysM repeat protein